MSWWSWLKPAKPVVFDDFTGPAGPPGPLWTVRTADTTGWGNGEIGNYVPSNVYLDGHSHLIVQAAKPTTGYTAGSVYSRGHLDMGLGKIEARIKAPTGTGIWPAFWLLGAAFDPTVGVGWPACGELDILESSLPVPNTITLHGAHPDGTEWMLQNPGTLPRVDLSQDFHTYWAVRTLNRITVGIDSTLLATYTPAALPAGAVWVFNAPMYVIFDVAVPGNWPGPPTASTVFPARMVIDWVRYTPT